MKKKMSKKKNLERVTLGTHLARDVEVMTSPYTVTGPGITAAPPLSLSTRPSIRILSLKKAKDEIGGEDAGQDQDSLEFVLTGSSLPIANLLRRLIISEVPTMAIDSVCVIENEGVVFDEALCHRLGLVPIHAPSHKFEYVSDMSVYNNAEHPDGRYFLRFTLEVEGKSDIPTPVYSHHLVWEPLPGQESLASYDIGVVNKNILIAKLAKGQRIKLRALAMKGLGMVHAKWSPVSCATYRMAPCVSINPKAKRRSAEANKEIALKCPMGVFDIEDCDTLKVVNEAACTGCRECIREESDDSEGVVILQRKKDELIFSVESLGQMSAVHVVTTALEDYSAHCRLLKSEVQNAQLS